MNRGSDRIVCLFATYCLAIVVAATSIAEMARGQETIPSPPPTSRNWQALIGDHPLPIIEHAISGVDSAQGQFMDRAIKALMTEFGTEGVAFRVTMPFPGRLLQNPTAGPTCCEELLQRLGAGPNHDVADLPCIGEINVRGVWLRPGEIIDTREVRSSECRLKSSEPCQETDEQHTANVTAQFIRFGCPCNAAGECTCGGQTTCGHECAVAAGTGCQCDDCKCYARAGQTDEATCGNDHCAVARMVIKHAEHHDDAHDHHPLKLMQHIAGLMAEKAAAEAALEVRKEADEQLGELYEAMSELLADNAALDAKVQAHADHTKLLERITDLAAENARLKAHVELADERAALTKGAFALTIENERLKLRLADLEQKHAAAEAARTAARPGAKTK
jgi:hypothetical protein